MKDTRSGRALRERKSQLNPDADRLVAGALGLSNSGSRAEDSFWEQLLAQRIDRLLEQEHNQAIFDAAERLQQTDVEAYGALIEAVENSAESLEIEQNGQLWDVVLISIPLVAWTRFRIPSCALSAAQTDKLGAAYRTQMLAKPARLALAPFLFSVDQLPRDFSDLRQMTRHLGAAALAGQQFKLDAKGMPDTADMLADCRYIVGAIATPKGQPLFRWQEIDSPAHVTRVSALEKWIPQARPLLESLLPGCGFECLLPDAYHINLRESDRRVRPHAVRAGVSFLTHSVGVDVDKIRASIAGFGSDRTEEYRIGLIVGDGDEVAQGVVWPVFGPENDGDELTPIESIKEVLRECGVHDIRVWPTTLDPEFCEDCGAPMFPNNKGDIVHLEIPDDADPSNQRFH